MRIHKTFVFIYLIAFLAFLRTQADQESTLYLAEKFKQLQENVQCSANSPIQDLDYGLKKVGEIKGITFCDQYAKRTCCSDENFTDVKRKWFREYSSAISMSPQCQEVFQKLVCYDCDGDIGIKSRRGLCPSLCTSLFKSCLYDVFAHDEKVANKVRFCRGSDILCSEMRYIFKDGLQFCRALGFEVNQNANFDEWYDDLLLNSTKKTPACWDGTPSQRVSFSVLQLAFFQIFGPAFNFGNKSRFSGANDRMQNMTAHRNKKVSILEQNIWVVYTIIGFLLLGIAMVVTIKIIFKQKEE